MSKVLLIATGGTIAMRKDEDGKAVPAIKGKDLVYNLPASIPDTEVEVVDFSNLASCNMKPERMHALAKVIDSHLMDREINGVIITHGTDTLEETAFFLDVTIPDRRPIILTASQRDASEFDTDGPRNLRNAMLIAVNKQAQGRGVMIALNEEIHAARDVRKLHTSHVDAFDSGDLGTIGGIDNETVIWYRQPEPAVKLELQNQLAHVAIIKAYTGMSPKLLEAALERGVEGLVIEGFGRGNLPPELVPVIRQTVERGIPVVITSRCLFGRTAAIYGYPGGGADLEKAGVWFSGDLSTEKTRLLLSLALANKLSGEEIKQMLNNGGINMNKAEA